MKAEDNHHLRRHRRAAGMTQRALAQAVNAPVGQIRALERGEPQGLPLALRIGFVLDEACPR